MQNNIIREFEDHPEVVVLVYEEGGRNGETEQRAARAGENHSAAEKHRPGAAPDARPRAKPRPPAPGRTATQLPGPQNMAQSRHADTQRH